MKLYEIDKEIQRWIDEHEDLRDEQISQEAFDRLAELKLTYDQKLGNIGRLIKNLAAEAEAIRTEEIALKERRYSVEGRVEGLKKYVSLILSGERWSDSAVAFSFRKSEAVLAPNDPMALPPKFRRTKTTIEVDKEKLKEALKAGETIPGAALESRMNLQIK